MTYRHALTYLNSRTLRALLALLMTLLAYGTCRAADPVYHLKLGYSSWSAPDASKEDVRAAFNVLTRRIAAKNGWTSESRPFDSAADMGRALQEQSVNVLAMYSEEYLELRKRATLEPLLVSVGKDGRQAELLLLVRRDSGIHTLRDLKGKSILLPERMRQSRDLYMAWLDSLLQRDVGSPPERHFSAITRVQKISRIITPVFFRQADACLVTRQFYDMAAELNPQVGRELTAIAQADDLTLAIIAVDRNLPDEIKKKISQVIQSLHREQEGRQLLTLFKVDRMIPFRPEQLNRTEALLSGIRERKTATGRGAANGQR